MALRLTTTSLSTDEFTLAPDSLEAGEDAAALLAANARRALAKPDFTATLGRLFVQAAEIGHEVPRYRARKLLVEQCLEASQRLEARAAVRALLAAAGGALAALEDEPAQPLLLNYAGVALYELWALDAAQALFEAAQRLDPELPNVERNLKAVVERRRTRPRQGAKPHAMVLGHAKAGLAIAARAKPASGLRISLCMITRDEEAMLPRTLAAVAPAVDEIIVVDTGSHDSTIEIARSFGANVLQREWTGDFSAARNASFDAATGDWILYLDADEVLDEGQAPKLRALAGETWREANFIEELNLSGKSDGFGSTLTSEALRIFRNRPEYRFQGRLHEQIAKTLPSGMPERIGHSSVQITHYGYLDAVRATKDKSRRNLELLERERQDGVDTPFLHFNLGSEYLALGECGRARDEFARAWPAVLESGIARHHFAPTLAVRRTQALRATRDFEAAVEFAEEALTYFPDFTDIYYEQGLNLLALDRVDQATSTLGRAIELGDAPARYSSTLGAGTYLPRLALAGVYSDRGEYDEALELQRWCVEHYPDQRGVVEKFAATLARSGMDAERIVATIEALVPKFMPWARYSLALQLLEQNAPEAAARQLEVVLDAQPHSGPARATLVETLLYQRDYARAARVAAAIEESNPLAVRVLRSELLAQLLGRDRDGARKALGRAQRIGLPPAECQMYELWLAGFDGEQPSKPLPVAALAALESIMTSLLLAKDAELFDSARALYMSCTLPAAERRDRLAQIYMKCGLPRAAAREWLAVCKTAPSLPALRGLAQVAMTNDQPATAAEFARQALALAPGDTATQETLAAAQAALIGSDSTAPRAAVNSVHELVPMPS